MTLRQAGLFVTVICDGCGAEHETTEARPLFAFYDATIRRGWKGYSEITPRPKPGVYCPGCQEVAA